MKAISLWQPWASLCVTPSWDEFEALKRFETRSWALPGTIRHGRTLIHASRRWTHEQRDFWDELRTGILACYRLPESLPFGALVGSVLITHQYITDEIRDRVSSVDLALGNWSDGRAAWRIYHPKVFEIPIPFRGRQGIFEVPDDVMAVHTPN